jgi:hypothetical protein
MLLARPALEPGRVPGARGIPLAEAKRRLEKRLAAEGYAKKPQRRRAAQ